MNKNELIQQILQKHFPYTENPYNVELYKDLQAIANHGGTERGNDHYIEWFKHMANQYKWSKKLVEQVIRDHIEANPQDIKFFEDYYT